MSIEGAFTTVRLTMRRGDDEPRLALVDTRIEDGPAELDLTDPDVLAAVAATLSDDPVQFDGYLSKLRSGSPF